MILLTFRYGLLAAEICDLRWEQIDFKTANLHVRRVKKNHTASTHPLTGRELRALRNRLRESEGSPFVFVSLRTPVAMPRRTRATILARWPAYLGHRNIQNATCYTALAPDRFNGFWKD